MIKLLKQNGFYEDRQDGSHKFFKNPELIDVQRFLITIKPLKRERNIKILKDAGIK